MSLGETEVKFMSITDQMNSVTRADTMGGR